MPHYTEYACTRCKKKCERDVLVAKKVSFSALGPGGKVIRSRTTDWLCDECLPLDEHWNIQPYSGAPGLKSDPLERVRAAQSHSTGETK